MTVLTGSTGNSQDHTVPRCEVRNGVTILRSGCAGARDESLAGRLKESWAFYPVAAASLLRVEDPDVFLVQTTPPLIVVLASWIARMRGVPVVYWLQDLYPDTAEALGVLSPDGVLAKVLRKLHHNAMLRARSVVVPGRDVRERLLTSGVPGDRVVVLYNWADPELSATGKSTVERLRSKWGLEGKRVVMYSGNLGRAHYSEEILEAAAALSGRQDVAFVIVGGGTGWKWIREEAGRRALPNTVFLPYQDRQALGQSLAVGDVHLITQRAETVGMLVPSKLYGALASGKPVVFMGPENGEVARTLRESYAGLTVPPGDMKAFVGAICHYLDDSEDARVAGNSGLGWVRAHASRSQQTAELRRLLEFAA